MNKTIAIFIAVILFIGVIFQAMVIIDYHSDEFNPGFFKRRENPTTYFESFDEAIANQFFMPFDIYLRDGDKTWIVKKDEDLFNTLWKDGKSAILTAMSRETVKSNDSWAELSNEAGILFKMGGLFPIGFVNFLMDNNKNTTQIDSMEKFLIIPDGNVMYVYIKSGEEVYEAELPASGLFTSSNFAGLISLFTADPYYSQNSYTEIHKFVDESVLGKFIEPDIPVTLDVNSRNLPWLKLSIPVPIREYIDAVNNSDSASRHEDIDEASLIIKSNIISRTLNTYEMHLDSFDNLFFSNQFNIYEVSKTGWISYNYTEGTQGDEKGDIGPAFMKAVETLNNIMRLSKNSGNLYLSGIYEDDESYSFTFDYRFEGNVIVIEGSNHAVEIRSTGTRTIEAKLYPLNIEKMVGDQYIDSKYKTAFLFITNFNGISNINTIEAYEMYLGYVKTGAVLEVVKPYWIMEKKTGEKQVLNLVEAGD
ncbi:MAG: hypothetical protein JXN10_01070 [Clostridia bacterium]|nr:hypothetical protein [Clostridia bacterium]MBN2882091.1 hypothetical protein [Clostridia bacterium]